jgi:succinylglutamate desuccinylase
MKKILFIVCTHGDELAGYNIFLKYPYGRTNHVEWKVVVGNPEAVMLNSRYVESDLNRSCNVKNPKTYEEKRGVLLKKIMEDYDLVYDIHTTTAVREKSPWEKVIFVNNVNKETMQYAKNLDFDYVIWDSDIEYQKQYVTALHPIGITLEYVKFTSVAKTQAMIEKDFLAIVNGKNSKKKQIVVEAYKPVTQEERTKYKLQLKEFVKLTQKEKQQLSLEKNSEYYPIFINTPETDPVNYCFLNKDIK